MSTVSNLNVSLLAPPNVPASLRAVDTTTAGRLQGANTEGKDALREAFTQFVGETFFGQMIKAMRSTVGKPAYFHGGQAEEMFRGQLDQKLAEHMTKASADRFAEPLFHRQFPKYSSGADSHRAVESSGFDQLRQLSRR